MVDDEQFFAWLDGELPPLEAARVEAEVAADPHLAHRAEEHRAMAAALRQAFGEVERQSVPDRLQSASARSLNVVSLAGARADREARKAPSKRVQMSALAATLAVGIFTGTMMTGMPTSGPSSSVETEGGRFVASGDLEEALETQLASAPNGSGVRIGLTFREQSGAICRTFQDRAANGLACREGDDWRIRGMFQSPEGQDREYRMASGQDPQLMEQIESSIEGDPFDAAQEQAAMERGWH